MHWHNSDKTVVGITIFFFNLGQSPQEVICVTELQTHLHLRHEKLCCTQYDPFPFNSLSTAYVLGIEVR